MSRQTLQELLLESPFHQLLNLKVDAFDAGGQRLTLRAGYGPSVERTLGSGQYHGGVIASLIDIAGDFALIGLLGYGVPTVNFRVDYLRPVSNTDLIAIAQVRRAGRSIGIVDVEVIDAGERLVALGRGCYGTRPG